VRSRITPEKVASAKSNDELFELLSDELDRLNPKGPRADDEFVAELRRLPRGLRAMAATYELDVSMTLDDIGWHFGNWHHKSLAKETLAGLTELGARELASLFRQAFLLAQEYWVELDREDWSEWYPDSPLAQAVAPLNEAAWAILEPRDRGIMGYWLEYARKHPERLR
jgi:hypothetical protein